MPFEPRSILLTGASGVVGTALLPGLRQRWNVTAVDRRGRTPSVERADLRHARTANRLCRGHDVVVALAAFSGVRTPWQDVHRTNLALTWNTLEAARRAGARRVILASSNNVTGMYEHDEPYRSVLAGDCDHLDPTDLPLITVRMPVRPNGAYAVGKVSDEAMARYYSETHGLSVLCLRIGTVRASDRPGTPRQRATLLTHQDLLHLVSCCVAAPEDLRFGVYYGVSANSWRIWDISDAERDLGYRPADDASALPTGVIDHQQRAATPRYRRIVRRLLR